MFSASPFLTRLLCCVIILQMFSLCCHEYMTISKGLVAYQNCLRTNSKISF